MTFPKILTVLCAIALAMSFIAFGATAAPWDNFSSPIESMESLGFIGLAGLLVNKQTLSDVFISLKTSFNNAFAAAPTVWQKIAMKVTSNTSQNDYAWLSKFPRMREWIGDQLYRGRAARSRTTQRAGHPQFLTMKRRAGFLKTNPLTG